MDDHYEHSVEMEKEAKFNIIQLEEAPEDSETAMILDDAKNEITKLYVDFRTWLQDNVNSLEVNERLQNLKQDSATILDKTKKKVKDFTQRDDVQAGKEKLEYVGNKVVNCLSDGVTSVMQNEHVSKVVDSISDTVTTIRHDERIQKGVKDFKKGTLKVAETAFNGLKRVLDTDDNDDDNSQKG